jgi:hypothetical protein
MKKLICVLVIVFTASMFFSCQSKKEKTVKDEVESLVEQLEDLPKGTTSPKKVFMIESAYVKYKNNAAGQDMIREWWFDDYGNKQFEENYMMIMGQKAGGFALVSDGYRYTWSYDSKEGSKSKFYSAEAVDYENVSDKDKERYGLEKQGYETIAGKRCLKVTMEKPVKATSWIWEGIPMKTITQFAGQDVTMEAVEISTSISDKSVFQIPESIQFTEN